MLWYAGTTKPGQKESQATGGPGNRGAVLRWYPGRRCALARLECELGAGDYNRACISER